MATLYNFPSFIACDKGTSWQHSKQYKWLFSVIATNKDIKHFEVSFVVTNLVPRVSETLGTRFCDKA